MGQLFVISAPSGAGKTSLVRALLAARPNLVVSISHTTRTPRPQELDGRDYYFVTPARFHEVFLMMAAIPLLAVPGFLHLRPEDGFQVSRHVRRLPGGKDERPGG